MIKRLRRAGPGGKQPVPGEKSERSGRRTALILCIAALPVLLGFFALMLYLSFPHTPGEELRLDQFLQAVRQGRVQSAQLLDTDNRVVGDLDGGKFWLALPGDHVNPIYQTVVGALQAANVPTTIEQQPLKGLVNVVTVLLPALIIVDGIFIIFLWMGRGGEGFAAFSRSGGRRVQSGDSKITFADVAGVEEAVEELAEVRDYLGNPERFLAMGAAVPKGILVTGPPGCGKTLLARGLAGEAEVPFFSISGSDFVEMFVGVGAARIRDFFKTAKAAAPCIVFIDELDAVGRSRGAVAIGGQDEREATLNQLLVEMDGFDSGTGIVVLAATNRPDILDTALTRPGRFDRRIVIDRPDVRGREAILRIHTRGKPLGADVDIAEVAKRTVGFSGADLANVVNEAALLAARRRTEAIDQRLMTEAIERVVAGPERKSRILSPQDRQRIAVHEAGHAVVSAAVPGTERVGKVSIVARGHAGGFTWWIPDGDQFSVTRSQLLDRIAAMLAGRAAEEVVLGENSSGAISDLDAAVTLARRMVCDFGMSPRLGAFAVRPGQHATVDGLTMGCSERVASEIDADIQQTLEEASARALAILRTQRPALDAVVQTLLEQESLEGDALDELLLRVMPEPRVAAAAD